MVVPTIISIYIQKRGGKYPPLQKLTQRTAKGGPYKSLFLLRLFVFLLILMSDDLDELTYQVPTSIFGVESYRNIVSEKYYNPAGIESDTPFKGVNIVVTRYSDGSTSTVKVLK